MDPAADREKFEILDIVREQTFSPASVYEVWGQRCQGPDSPEKRERFHRHLLELEENGLIVRGAETGSSGWADSLHFWAAFGLTDAGKITLASVRRAFQGWEKRVESYDATRPFILTAPVVLLAFAGAEAYYRMSGHTHSPAQHHFLLLVTVFVIGSLLIAAVLALKPLRPPEERLGWLSLWVGVCESLVCGFVVLILFNMWDSRAEIMKFLLFLLVLCAIIPLFLAVRWCMHAWKASGG